MSPHKILVVDDEEQMCKLCGRILRGMGYEALFARTLAEAREKLASLERLDLLVSDLKLPDGHGLDVIAATRAKFPSAGVMVITGFLDLELQKERFRSLGVLENDILTKPFSLDRFEALVRSNLADRKGQL